MQENQVEVLPAKPAADQLSVQLYNEHRIECSVRKLLVTHLTAHLDPNKKISALVLGGRCGLVPEILLPYCSEIDIVEQEPYARVLETRFLEGKDVDYFFGKEGFIGSRHLYPAPVLAGQKVRVIRAEQLRSEGRGQYDLIVLQNPIITAEQNLIEQLLATQHSLLLTMMVPGKISDPRLFGFFARFERQVIQTFYQTLSYQSVQNHRHITGRRGEIIYYEIYTFQRRQGLPLTEQQLLQLLGEDTQENQEGTEVHANPYEHKKMLDTYIAFHYGPSIFGIDNFPKACAQLCIGEAQKRGLQGRVLDLGCAVGRSTIELAQYFQEAVGLDYSNAFVETAKKTALEQYPQLAGKTRFVVGDACNLDKSLGKFSLIFGGNLIDRLPDPAAFILSVTDFLEPNGLLVLTSPYTWLAEYTAPEKWIGGIVEKGVEVSTAEGVGRLLLTVGVSECRQREDLRFVIKVNDWVYEYTLANVTFWAKQ